MSELLHVVCGDCHVTNRVPAARVGQAPTCGRCGHDLFGGRAVALGDANFDRHLRGDVPLLVDFWAPWCGPCRTMAPQFEAAAARLEPDLRLAKVDTEQSQALAARYAIRSIPTLVVLRGGVEIARRPGAMSAGQIESFAREALASAAR